MDDVPVSVDLCVYSASDAITVVRALVPEARATLLNVDDVSPISGGITNTIYKVDCREGLAVLVRIFGATNVFSDAQRNEENVVFKELAACGIAPGLIGIFGNGRVEQWLEATPTTVIAMRNENVLVGVAQAMAKLHTFCPSTIVDISLAVPVVWDSIRDWIDNVKALKLSPPSFDVKLVEAEVSELRAALENSSPSPVCFSHNDLLSGNILVDTKDDRVVHIIDFEYSNPNYRGFDIGNFFSECMGGTDDGVVNLSTYPSTLQQALFCRTYLANQNIQTNCGQVSDEQVQALVREANLYSLLSHLYWVSWAVVQSSASHIDFPYLLYAKNRLQIYFHFKKVFLTR